MSWKFLRVVACVVLVVGGVWGEYSSFMVVLYGFVFNVSVGMVSWGFVTRFFLGML